MYAVWRKKLITSDRKTELFVDYFTGNLTDAAGKVLKSGYQRQSATEREAWKPLWCEHKGDGRIAWTPRLVQTRRVKGEPRQKTLGRLPTIRTCCMADPLLRAAWWYEVEQTLMAVAYKCGLPKVFSSREGQAIVATLRKVVPPLTSAELRAFREHRVARHEERQGRLRQEAEERERQRQAQAEAAAQERERQRQAQAIAAAKEHARQRQARAEAEERARQHRARAEAAAEALRRLAQEAEERRRRHEEWQRNSRRYTASARAPGSPNWWDTLGLSASASIEEIKKAYRELVMQYHPDRGGDSEAFKWVHAAYEQAMRQHGRPR